MSFWLVKFAYASCFIGSIGLSDAIELFTNPLVHYYHNCPDIMKMKWSDYKWYHAFMSAIKCSWFFIPVLMMLPFDKYLYWYLMTFNTILPVIMRIVQGKPSNAFQGTDIFLGHKLLYIINFSSFLIYTAFRALQSKNDINKN